MISKSMSFYTNLPMATVCGKGVWILAALLVALLLPAGSAYAQHASAPSHSELPSGMAHWLQVASHVVLLSIYVGILTLLFNSVRGHWRSSVAPTLALLSVVVLAAALTQAVKVSHYWWSFNHFETAASIVAAIAAITALIALTYTVPRSVVFRGRDHLQAAERELRESKARFERAILGASQGLWEWNIRDNVMWFAPRFKELLGFNAAEFPDTFERWESALHPEDRQPTLDALQSHLDREDAYEIEHRLQTKTGEYRWFHTRGMAIRDPDGQPYLLSGSMHDVHDRRIAEETIRQRDIQLQQKQNLEAIGELAAGIVHEINSPIQCVAMNIDFIKDCYEKLGNVLDTYRSEMEGPGTSWQSRKAKLAQLLAQCQYESIREQVPAAVEEASMAVSRVTEIVQAMKTMSHPGVKQKVLTSLNEIVRGASIISRNRWKYCARLEFDLDESLPEMEVFPTELQQVIVNLIVNAADAIVAKHGESGADLGAITIRTAAMEDCVRIEVQDTGCGMPDEVKRRIFEPFFTTKDVGKGTGQGLAISYSVAVLKHGGTIDVETEPGIGTRFIVALPRPRGGDELGPEDERINQILLSPV